MKADIQRVINNGFNSYTYTSIEYREFIDRMAILARLQELQKIKEYFEYRAVWSDNGDFYSLYPNAALFCERWVTTKDELAA
jgi:hypothetical protein